MGRVLKIPCHPGFQLMFGMSLQALNIAVHWLLQPEVMVEGVEDLRFEPDPRLFDAVTVSAHDFLTRLFDRQAG